MNNDALTNEELRDLVFQLERRLDSALQTLTFYRDAIHDLTHWAHRLRRAASGTLDTIKCVNDSELPMPPDPAALYALLSQTQNKGTQ